MVGRPPSSAGCQPSWHLRSCLYPQVWGIERRFLQASALRGRKFRLPQCFMTCDGLFVWKHLLDLLLLLLGVLLKVLEYITSLVFDPLHQFLPPGFDSLRLFSW